MTNLRKENKMKLKRISFKIISLIMVFTMLFSISANTICAMDWTHDDHTHSNGKDKINYVSLGESMIRFSRGQSE